jgi:protein involved in polysaccharide export with SLBB domain
MRSDRACPLPAFLAVLVGVAVTPLLGCSILNGFLDPTAMGSFPLEYREGGIRRVLTPRESPPGLAGATEPTPEDLVPVYEDYRIGVGDQVAISIEDLTAPGAIEAAAHEVTPTGYVRLPILGSVKVAGMTEAELEQELKSQLKETNQLPNPIVRVFVQLKRQAIFTIIGSVSQAGPYPITEPDMRLLDAIGMARDITPNVKSLYVIRREAQKEGVSTTPMDAPEPDRGIVVPPPDIDEDKGETRPATFLTQSGVGRDEPPGSKPAAQDDLESVIRPGGMREGSATLPAQDSDDRRFPPLIIDPETGNPVEVKPEHTPEELAAPARRTTEEPPQQPGFNWDEVPEHEATQRVIEIDVESLRNGDPRQNIVIRNRDVINVPTDVGVFYMMGEINRPGVYGLGGREITIKQAVAIGGGLTPLAWPQRCEIIRREKGTDKQITIPVNLDGIFAGLEDDLLLKDDDVLNVGTHFVAPFLFVIRNSFRFTYGFGFVYDRNFADKDAYGSRQNPEAAAAARRASRGLPF